MTTRRISTTEVEEILVSPNGLIAQSQDKVIAYREFAGRSGNAVAVVAVKRDQNFEVVTVMVNF